MSQPGCSRSRFSGEFADAEEALAWLLSWPLAAARLARLEPGRRERFFSEAREALAAANLSWTLAFNFYVAHRPNMSFRSAGNPALTQAKTR